MIGVQSSSETYEYILRIYNDTDHDLNIEFFTANDTRWITDNQLYEINVAVRQRRNISVSYRRYANRNRSKCLVIINIIINIAQTHCSWALLIIRRARNSQISRLDVWRSSLILTGLSPEFRIIWEHFECEECNGTKRYCWKGRNCIENCISPIITSHESL